MNIKKISITGCQFIEGEVEFQSNGIFNYADNLQKGIVGKCKDYCPAPSGSGKNLIYGQAIFEKNPAAKNSDVFGIDNDTYVRRLAITPDCIRHTMYEDVMPFHNANSLLGDSVTDEATDMQMSLIATKECLVRGYMYANGGNKLTKASALHITPAVQKAGDPGLGYLSIGSPSGARSVLGQADDENSNTFYHREMAGIVNYTSKFQIDLKELAFISLSDRFSRRAVPDSRIDDLRNRLAQVFGMPIPEPGHYYKSGDPTKGTEFGILLPKEIVQMMVQDTLTRLATIHKYKRASAATLDTTKLSFTCCTDAHDRFMLNGEPEYVIDGGSNIVITEFDYVEGYELGADLTEASEMWAKARAERNKKKKAAKKGKDTESSETED